MQEHAYNYVSFQPNSVHRLSRAIIQRRELVQREVPIDAIIPLRSTLEDVFLEATR